MRDFHVKQKGDEDRTDQFFTTVSELLNSLYPIIVREVPEEILLEISLRWVPYGNSGFSKEKVLNSCGSDRYFDIDQVVNI
jgi:hypothetical protein